MLLGGNCKKASQHKGLPIKGLLLKGLLLKGLLVKDLQQKSPLYEKGLLTF
jgi:hypothetical protein